MPAVRGAFVLFGVFWGSWAVAALDVQVFLGLSDSGLGGLLAVTVLGGAAANALGGPLTERHGTRDALAAALVLWAAALAGLALVRQPVLFAALFLVGITAGGLVDVVMNIAGTAALGGAAAPFLRLHACFNAGAVLGAAVTGAALAVDVSWRVVWALIAAGALALAGLARRRGPGQLPGPDRSTARPPGREQASLRAAFTAVAGARMVPVALVFAGGALVEGGVGTWGVLALRTELGVAAIGGAVAYVAGQVLATVARVSVGWLSEHVGGVTATRVGLAVAGVGLVLEAVSPWATLAAAGLALAAVGSAVYWPMLLASASSVAHRPAVVVGALTAAGYIGFLAGPPAVGVVADQLGVRAGIAVLAAVAASAAAVPLRSLHRAGAERVER